MAIIQVNFMSQSLICPEMGGGKESGCEKPLIVYDRERAGAAE